MYPGFSIQTGEVRHCGPELEGRGQLTEQLALVAGYTYVDARSTTSNDGDAGNRTAPAPCHRALLWAD